MRAIRFPEGLGGEALSRDDYPRPSSADSFTVSPFPPIGMLAELRILHSASRENRVLSVWRP
jgi:hypothetical protein